MITRDEEITPEEGYQEALRRIAAAHEQRLAELNLTNLLWDRIPPELFKLEWLSVLYIGRDLAKGRGKIQHLPAEFALFKLLQILDISYHSLTGLRPLAGLLQLQRLGCRGNDLIDLRPLAGLTQLQVLACGRNRLMGLEPLAGLTQLQNLYCGGNPGISAGPLAGLEELAGLTQLQVLACGSTGLTDLEPLAGLTRLQLLACGGNRLTDLEPLAGLTRLQTLHCENNRLTDLEPLAGLTRLQTLTCGGNLFTDLEPLASLTRLQTLHCESNRLTDLGPLAGLTQLQRLNCQNNQISNLTPIKPAILVKRLTHLYVFNNPVRSLPAELLGSRAEDDVAEKLRDYWQELDQGAEPNRDVKVILIGNGYVGKTTLAYALRHRCRPPEHIIERTHGIVIDTLEWQLLEDEQPIRVQLWDLGGQEIYHATHRLFLHGNALYLLLWAEETDEALGETRHPVSYWLSLVHDLAADSLVILVKNQIDRSDRLSRPADLDTPAIFAQELKISALYYQGIATLHAAIGEQLQALKDRWSYLIPQSWLRLKEVVSSRREDKTLSRAHYAQLCIQHGIQHADTLLGYLHDSGFLFYRQDRFGDQIILDQNWMINIIYRLLDPAEHIRKRLIRQSGIFSGNDTGDFWREYSPEERKIFIDFMLNCEMAFKLDEHDWQKDFNGQQFVLPALLPQMPPTSVTVWGAHQPGEWWLDFSYSFLHRALIERLIVRTARLSPARDWYHDGILLVDDETGCQLLLQYQPELTLSQVIRLRIRGQQKSRAYTRVSNLLTELHPRYSPEVFVSLDGRHFVSRKILQQAVHTGAMHIVCRDGQIVESQPYRGFFYIEDREERFAMPSQPLSPVRIFISYAHEDETHKKRLETCLKGIKRRFNIDYWEDRQLFAGDQFEQTILAKLREADIICLLISPDFIESDYCFNKEMEQALQQYEQNAGIPIPIIIRRTDEWQAHQIGRHTALPTDGKPLSQWNDADDFWADIQQGIRRQVERIIKQRSQSIPAKQFQ